MWKVYYKVDSSDNYPDIYTFDDRDIMDDFIYEEINRRVQFIVDHSPYALSEEDIEDSVSLASNLPLTILDLLSSLSSYVCSKKSSLSISCLRTCV